MRYTVTWSGTAETDLARHWATGGPREKAAIDAAVSYLDRTLLNDPDLLGEPVFDPDLPRRTLFLWEPTIAGRTAYVLFEVHEEDRIVEVHRASLPLGR